MPFTLLKGTFKPAAGKPDGDSIRFAPDNPALLFDLHRRGKSPRLHDKNKTIQLRYEGIDALEKAAIKEFSDAALQKNLELLDLADRKEEEGYILARQTGPYGRPICFVFAGRSRKRDGASVYLEKDLLQESVNYQLLEAGAAYPLFYDTLFADLRSVLASASKQARAADVGFWSADKTKTGVRWRGIDSLSDLDPIMPKLWRRLKKYAKKRAADGEPDTLGGFMKYLRANPDRLVIIEGARATDFDNIVEVDGRVVKFPLDPEDVFFIS